MYGREQRVLLRHYLERGLSKAHIARELGVSRRTVYHWIESGQLEREPEGEVRYGPRPRVARHGCGPRSERRAMQAATRR